MYATYIYFITCTLIKYHDFLPNRLQSTTESKTGTIQRKKIKRKKSSVEQKKWIFKGRIATELMEIENLEDGACECLVLCEGAFTMSVTVLEPVVESFLVNCIAFTI